jgi:integrase/recombinase XerD
VAHQRIFGRRYYAEEYVLRALHRFVARRHAADLSAAVFEQWCAALAHLSPNTRRGRQLLVRKLCLFRRRREPKCFVPDPTGFARPRPYRSPVIVTSAQVASLLRAADKLVSSQHFPLRPAVMRMAIVLLYTAGLRRGELIRLLLADVDAHNGILRIRESKFHRSRWVPLSPDACLELRSYLRQRLKSPLISDRQRRSSVMAAVATAVSDGMPIQELPSGKGFARSLIKLVSVMPRVVARGFMT